MFHECFMHLVRTYHPLKLNTFKNLSLHHMFRPTRPSSGASKFGGTAVPSALQQSQAPDDGSAVQCSGEF
jgi:hypothetical protein